MTIRTSHVGRLPAPAGYEDLRRRLAVGEDVSARLTEAVAAIVARQAEIGIDCIGDGELGAGFGFDFYDRQMTGLAQRPLHPGEVAWSRESTRERDGFPQLYADMDRVGTLFCVPGETPMPPVQQKVVVTGPVSSRGIEDTRRQIETFKAAIERAGVKPRDAFIPALAPGWLDHFIFNEFYKGEEEFVFALAEAMRDKYRAITEAGFLLQIDDPGIATSWDMIKPRPSMEDYRRYIGVRIEALNHALAGIPEDRVRYHFCWGSWHGAHVNDIPLREIIGTALQVQAGIFSFEAGNVRHEHEWTVWQEVKLKEGTRLMPGVVSHATNIVEHPELIARRLAPYAKIVGADNVIAGTDCGLGSRVHPELVWAKLQALVEGAALASRQAT